MSLTIRKIIVLGLIGAIYLGFRIPFSQEHLGKCSFSALSGPGNESHFMADEAKLIYNVSQVTFLHADHFIARLENSQETTSIENREIINYRQFKPNRIKAHSLSVAWNNLLVCWKQA